MFEQRFHRRSPSSRSGPAVPGVSLVSSGSPAGSPLPSRWLPSQGDPTQQVMGYRYQEHHCGDFGDPSYRKLSNARLPHLGVGPFSSGGISWTPDSGNPLKSSAAIRGVYTMLKPRVKAQATE